MDHHQVGLEQGAQLTRKRAREGGREGFEVNRKQHQQGSKTTQQGHAAFGHGHAFPFHGSTPPPCEGRGEARPEQERPGSCRPSGRHAVHERHVASSRSVDDSHTEVVGHEAVHQHQERNPCKEHARRRKRRWRLAFLPSPPRQEHHEATRQAEPERKPPHWADG